MKKIFLVLSVIFAVFVTMASIALGYSDVEDNDPFVEAINYLTDKGVISGYPDGTYRPESTINRAELLKIVVEAAYDTIPESYTSQQCFSDIEVGAWYTKYVCFAKDEGIVNGYPDGSFKPDQNIIFVEALKIALIGFGYDSETKNPWYKGYVDRASEKNFIPLEVLSFDEDFSRGKMADLITRILKDQEGILTDYLRTKADYIVTYSDIENGISEINKWEVCVKSEAPVLHPDSTYIIIGREKFEDTLVEFIEHKESEGQKIAYYDLNDIVCNNEGRDIPEQIRNFLKEAKGTTKAKYLLLVGTPLKDRSKERSLEFYSPSVKELTYDWEMPIRYVTKIQTYDDDDSLYIPTDQYYASLSGSWDNNNNDIFGEYLSKENEYEISFDTDLYVGRVPVQTTTELKNWIKKTVKWKPKQNPIHSRFISARCDGEYDKDDNGNPFDENGLEKTHDLIFHYCIDDNGGDIAELANIDQADFVSSYSHGYFTYITKSPSEIGYDLDDASPGFDKNSVMYVHGCNINGLDYYEKSLGEDLIARSDGVTAIVASTRSHRDLPFNFWNEVFFKHNYEIGPAMFGEKESRWNYLSLDDDFIDNFAMFNLFGDPSLKLIEPQVEIFVESTIIDFENKAYKDVNFEIENNTNEEISGTLIDSYIYSESIQKACNGECEEVSIGPKDSKSFFIQLMAPYYYYKQTMLTGGRGDGVFSPFTFKFKPENTAVGADSAILVNDTYLMTCDKTEDQGDQWKVLVKLVGDEKDTDYRLVATINSYHTGDEDNIVTAYEGSINPFEGLTKAIIFDKINEYDENGQEYEWSKLEIDLQFIDEKGDAKTISACQHML